jgi:hypothetical protein
MAGWLRHLPHTVVQARWPSCHVSRLLTLANFSLITYQSTQAGATTQRTQLTTSVLYTYRRRFSRMVTSTSGSGAAPHSTQTQTSGVPAQDAQAQTQASTEAVQTQTSVQQSVTATQTVRIVYDVGATEQCTKQRDHT